MKCCLIFDVFTSSILWHLDCVGGRNSSTVVNDGDGALGLNMKNVISAVPSQAPQQ